MKSYSNDDKDFWDQKEDDGGQFHFPLSPKKSYKCELLCCVFYRIMNIVVNK